MRSEMLLAVLHHDLDTYSRIRSYIKPVCVVVSQAESQLLVVGLGQRR